MEERTTEAIRTGDGLEYLVRQHRQFEQLFDRFDSATDPKLKNEIVDEIVARVSLHASVEEQHVYPLFRDKLPNGDIIYKRNRMDDQMNKEILDLLLEMDALRDGELYDRTVRKFMMIEREHMEQEEERFTELRSMMSHDELSKLEESLISSERVGPSRPHPRGPSTGLAAKLTHPLAGAADKVMDTITGRSKTKKNV